MASHSSLMVLAKMEIRALHPMTFKIPRKERRPSEDCQYTLPVDSREAKDIENAVKRQTWDTNDLDRAVSILQIKKVDNPNLEREYHEKRAQLRQEGRSLKELSEQLAFCIETGESRVKDICRFGLECSGTDHTLGDGGMGVTVWKCPDLCLRAFSCPSSQQQVYLLAFKIVKGRVKSVMPKLSSPHLEPTPNHDCHISRNTASSSVTDLATLLRSTQYYLYEYDDEGLPSSRPRHCLPFAVILVKRNEVVSPRSPKLRPLMSIESTLFSPGKEYPRHLEECKSMSFSDETGILAWRGLVMSGQKTLGVMSLLAGHKLGFNFMRSYLDVSRKIPLTQLAQMLPGDVRCAWNFPLIYRGHTLSLCTVKLAEGQPSESFTSFTRGLVIKAKSAGVLCIDPTTTMFLVPSCKLTVYLGFCESVSPPRVFCIICRRQSTALSPRSVWPLTNPFTPPSSNQADQLIKPSSLELKARYTAKIVVSSSENSPRLSPKRPTPRESVKRSLSFSYSSVKDATKPLQRTFRSASSSETVHLQEELVRPTNQSESPCDGNKCRTGIIATDSDIGYDSCEIKSLNLDSVECGVNSRKRSTTCFDKVLEASVGTLASFSPEQDEECLGRLASLRECSEISKDASRYYDFELELPLVEQTSANASSDNLTSPSSSMCRGESYSTIDGTVEIPSVVDDEYQDYEVGLRTVTNSSLLTEIPEVDTIWDLHDNLQPVDMEITDLLPSPIHLSQPYSYSTTHACNGDCTEQTSIEKLELNEPIPERSLNTESVQNVLVTIPEQSVFEVAETPTRKVVNQNEHTAQSFSPVNTLGVILSDLKSLDVDSTNSRVGVDPSESDTRGIIRTADVDIEGDSGTLVTSVAFENCQGKCQILRPSEVPHSSDMYALSNDDYCVSSVEQNVSGTCRKTEVEVVESRMPVDCCEGKSLSCDRPFSCSQRGSFKSQCKLQSSVLSTSSGNIQVQNKCSIEQNKRPSTSCAYSFANVLGFSLSSRTSAKLCIERLKVLQSSLKTATDLKTNQPVRDTCSSRRSVVDPPNTRQQEPETDNLEYFDCIGLTNSEGSVTKHEGELPKPLKFCSSADTNQITVIPKESQLYEGEGGVIEMSLVEDCGYQNNPTGSNKTQLIEEEFDLLDVQKDDDDRDPIDGDPVVESFETGLYIDECPMPEPEEVICSPLESLETFTFRFPGRADFDEDVTELTETAEEKAHLVQESVQLELPGIYSEIVVLPSENLVPEVSITGEACLENKSDIPESDDGQKENVDNMVCVFRTSQNVAENVCFNNLPEKHVFSSGNVKELKSSAFSSEQSSEWSEKWEEERLGSQSERREPQSLEVEMKRSVNSEEYGTLESMKCEDVTVDINRETHPSRNNSQMRSGKACEHVTQLQIDTIIDGHSDVALSTREGMGGSRECSLLKVQGKENFGDKKANEGSLSSIQGMLNGCNDDREEKTASDGDEIDTRVSSLRVRGEKYPGRRKELAKSLKSLQEFLGSLEEEVAVGDEKATAGESEAMQLSSPSLRPLHVERKEVHDKNAHENVGREKYAGKTLRISKGEEVETFHEEESKTETQKEWKHFNSENESEIMVEKTNYPHSFSKGRVLEESVKVRYAKDLSKPLAVAEGTCRNIESKSATTATITHLNSGKTGVKSNLAEKSLYATSEELVRESIKKDAASLTGDNKTRKANWKDSNSCSTRSAEKFTGKPKEVNVKNSTNSNPVENTSKSTIVIKRSNYESSIFSGTVQAPVKSLNVERRNTPVANATRTAGTPYGSSWPLSTNAMTDAQTKQVNKGVNKVCNSSAHYQGSQNKNEPLQDIYDLQCDNRLQNMKRKRAAEREFWAKQPKLAPASNKAVENGTTSRKLTPPPPLIPIDRAMKRGQEKHEIRSLMLRETNMKDPSLYRPYPERHHIEYQSPPVDYNQGSKRFKANNVYQSYPCWVSPLPKPLLFNNRGTDMLVKSSWNHQRGISSHDPRINRKRLDPAYCIFSNWARPVSQPSLCRLNPMLPPQHDLVPGPWLPPGNPFYVPYYLVRPR